ncbi:MAG: EAL domain-containing protein [Spirochaetales bacterium]|nr:EAL domain-containing protein [Spirochaetales bacterium]
MEKQRESALDARAERRTGGFGPEIPDVPTGPAEILRLKDENEHLRSRLDALERKLSLQPQSGLPTHFRLESELERWIEARNADAGFAVLIVQLGPNYATVRKTLRTSITEWLLYQTGCRVQALLREEDRVFHTREHEFVLLLPALKGKPLLAFLKKLLSSLSEPHVFAGFKIALQVSAGAAFWPEHADDKSELLHRADIAVGLAAERREAFVLFKDEHLERAIERLELQNDIIRAIESAAIRDIGEQFSLRFQPKLFASALEGDELVVERVEAEALIRWNHPDRGQLQPSVFIPLAEETGLIQPIGKWLIYQVARRLAEWKTGPLRETSLSLNLSARQFRSEDTIETLEGLVRMAGFDPSRLVVELTETSLFEDPDAAARILERFARSGFRVSVDDFGTGYSSLSHLHRFPLNEIKIDRLFVENLEKNRHDRVIIRSLVGIARGLELDLVAEGVERAEALRALWDMGCRGFQGFLIAKPLDAAEYEIFVAKLQAGGMRFRFA